MRLDRRRRLIDLRCDLGKIDLKQRRRMGPKIQLEARFF